MTPAATRRSNDRRREKRNPGEGERLCEVGNLIGFVGPPDDQRDVHQQKEPEDHHSEERCGQPCRPVQRDGGACRDQGGPGEVRPEAPCRNPFRNQRHDEIHVHVVLDSEDEHWHAEQDTAKRSEKALHRHARHGRLLT